MTETGGVGKFLFYILEMTVLNPYPVTGNAGLYFVGFVSLFRQMPI
jgi:hypothetical protein